MPEEELSVEILCDLIQRELENALEDLAVIRQKKSQESRCRKRKRLNAANGSTVGTGQRSHCEIAP